MELELIMKKNEPVKTKIKVSTRELQDKKIQAILAGLTPVKESSRYKYFIVDGDLLNRRKW